MTTQAAMESEAQVIMPVNATSVYIDLGDASAPPALERTASKDMGVRAEVEGGNLEPQGKDIDDADGDVRRRSQEHKDLRDRTSAIMVSFLSLVASFLAAVLGLGIGICDKELALVGFGMEGLLDALSSVLVLWRFKRPKARQHADEEAALRFKAARDLRRERNSSVGIGATFVASSALLLLSAALKLAAFDGADLVQAEGERDGANWSLILSMPFAMIFGGLAYCKFQLAGALRSQVLRKDALCSLLGAALAGICAAAGLAEEVFVENPESMAAVDVAASGAIALILMAEGGRTLWHNLGSGWEKEHQQMA